MKYMEDFKVGDVHEHGSRSLTREEIITFARDFDPQPFHLDEEFGKKTHFGGLVASGWHTASLAMRILVDSFTREKVASMGSPGADEIRWLKPVRPGDTLSLRTTVTEVTPSKSKPDRGTVKLRYEMRNQHGDVVFTMTGIGLIVRKPQGG